MVHVGGIGVGLRYISHEDAVDYGRINFAIGKGSFGGLNGQVSAGEIFELAAKSAESGTFCSNDEDCSLR